jgi:hypothetical protein
MLLEPYASEICHVNIVAGYASNDKPMVQQSISSCTASAISVTAVGSVQVSAEHSLKQNQQICQTKIAIVEFINEVRNHSILFNSSMCFTCYLLLNLLYF